MKYFVNHLNREVELETFEVEGKGGPAVIVKHRSLEDVLYNDLQKDMKLGIMQNYTAVLVSNDHNVFICTIYDAKGRRIQMLGESSPSNLDTLIAKEYPSMQAAQRAFDRAMIRYLDLPGRVLSELEMTQDELSRANSGNGSQMQSSASNAQVSRNTQEQQPSSGSSNSQQQSQRSPAQNQNRQQSQTAGNSAGASTQQKNAAPANGQPGAAQKSQRQPQTPAQNRNEAPHNTVPAAQNNNRPSGQNSAAQHNTTNTQHEPAQEQPPQFNSIDDEIAYYGKTVFQSGKYDKKTLAEVAKSDPGYLNYLITNSRASKYAVTPIVKKYLDLMVEAGYMK